MGILAIVGMFILSIAYFGVAALGFSYWAGPVWASVIVALCFWMRLTWVVSIGVFFGAYYVFEWHWIWAALLAFPGLLLLPVALGAGLSSLRNQ